MTRLARSASIRFLSICFLAFALAGCSDTPAASGDSSVPPDTRTNVQDVSTDTSSNVAPDVSATPDVTQPTPDVRTTDVATTPTDVATPRDVQTTPDVVFVPDVATGS